MKKIGFAVLTLVILLSLGAKGNAKTASPPARGLSNTYVLVVGGINKDVEEHQTKDQSVLKLRKTLTEKLRFDPKRVVVLVDKASFVTKPSGISTAENLEKTIQILAGRVKPSDRFIFYYVGQANVVGGKLRLNLPGPDITHEQLAQWLGRIKPSIMLVVLDCPASGLAVKSLAGPNRIIICSARSEQIYSTRFSEFFIPALANSESDANHDGRISILDAFQQTAARLDEFYREKNLMKTETPLLEDDGDGIPSQQPWLDKETKKDGLRASNFFLNSNPVRNKKP